MDHIQIRLEQPSDHRETENLTREAFWNQYCPGCSEHYLLHIMRDDAAFLPELDFVAVSGERIVGNSVCVRAVISGDDGREYEVLTLGPISVLPEWQRKGIGKQLLSQTRRAAREMGFRAILLCGDPEYYSRNGFSPAELYGIRTGGNLYAAALQACELYENALGGVSGRYQEAEVYEVDETEAARFDIGFPSREKKSGTQSQKRFEQIVAMCRRAD